MKKRIILFSSILLIFVIVFAVFIVNIQAADQTITENATGNHGGYDYELWKDNGTTSMTLKDGGAFSCSWNNINNALFRKGKKYDETKTFQEFGNITMKYNCEYQPSGNSYLAVYGWTSDPLVEYYVIESYGTWKPPGSNTPKETITVDGGTYEIYETTRTNQPSIKGTATFQQYWSVRTSKRTSGTVTVSDHFKAWEKLGMKLGKMYEVSLVVEGYQSSGKADVTSMSIDVGGNSIANTAISDSITNGPTTNNSTTTVNPDQNNVKPTEKPSVSPNNSNTNKNLFNRIFKWFNYSPNKNKQKVNNEKATASPNNSQQTSTNSINQQNNSISGKLVALTFDDGPSSQTTLTLDKLKKYNAKATFMVIGSKISNADPVMKRIVNEGHELGNHSWGYQSMDTMTEADVKDSISKTSEAIKKYSGTDPKFFRSPNLATSAIMLSTIKMTFVQGVIAQDWSGASATTAQARADLVINGVKDGSIVLLHSDQPDPHPTPEALDIIIPTLKQQGYSFVTLSELFTAKGITPPIGKIVDGAF